jgi:hypothetical protein
VALLQQITRAACCIVKTVSVCQVTASAFRDHLRRTIERLIGASAIALCHRPELAPRDRRAS